MFVGIIWNIHVSDLSMDLVSLFEGWCAAKPPLVLYLDGVGCLAQLKLLSFCLNAVASSGIKQTAAINAVEALSEV